MKKIEAIIRKSKFDEVKEALLEIDIEWLSYYEVRGVGKMRQERVFRGIAYDTSSIERTMVVLVVRDINVDKTVKAITEHAGPYHIKRVRNHNATAHSAPFRRQLSTMLQQIKHTFSFSIALPD